MATQEEKDAFLRALAEAAQTQPQAGTLVAGPGFTSAPAGTATQAERDAFMQTLATAGQNQPQEPMQNTTQPKQPTQEQKDQFFTGLFDMYNTGQLTPEQSTEFLSNIFNDDLTLEQRQSLRTANVEENSDWLFQDRTKDQRTTVNPFQTPTTIAEVQAGIDYLNQNRNDVSITEINNLMQAMYRLEQSDPDAFTVIYNRNPAMAMRYNAREAANGRLTNKEVEQRAAEIFQRHDIDPHENGRTMAYNYGLFPDVTNEWGAGDWWKIGTMQSDPGGLFDFVEENPLQVAGMVASFFVPQLSAALASQLGVSPAIANAIVNGGVTTAASGGDFKAGLVAAAGTYGLSQLGKLDSVLSDVGVDPETGRLALNAFAPVPTGDGEANPITTYSINDVIRDAREGMDMGISIPTPEEVARGGADTTPPEITGPEANTADLEHVLNPDGTVNYELMQDYLEQQGIDINSLPGISLPGGGQPGGGASADTGEEGAQTEGEAGQPAQGGSAAGLPPELEDTTIDSNTWWIVRDGEVYVRDYETGGWHVDESKLYERYGVDPKQDGQYYDNGQPVNEGEPGPVVQTPPTDLPEGYEWVMVDGQWELRKTGETPGAGEEPGAGGVLVTGPGTGGGRAGTGINLPGGGGPGTGRGGGGPGAGEGGEGGGQVPEGGPGGGPGTGETGPGPVGGEPGGGGGGEGGDQEGDKGDETGRMMQQVLSLLVGTPGAVVATKNKEKEPDKMEQYDWQTIFRNLVQEASYISPYDTPKQIAAKSALLSGARNDGKLDTDELAYVKRILGGG